MVFAARAVFGYTRKYAHIYTGTRTTLFVEHSNSVTELAFAERSMVPLILTLVASTAVVDYSVLGHARAATIHVATGWMDTASHRTRGCQAWIVVGACIRGWAFDDAAVAAAGGVAAAIGAATAFAPATSAAAVTSTGGGTCSGHSTCTSPLGPTSAVPLAVIAVSAGRTGRQADRQLQ